MRPSITRFAGHRLSVLHHHRGPGIFRIGDRVRCSTGYLTVTSAIVGDAVLRHVATSNSWRREARSMLSDLQVEERPRHHMLVLTDSDESSLLSLLARIAGDDREVQAMRGHRLTIG